MIFHQVLLCPSYLFCLLKILFFPTEDRFDKAMDRDSSTSSDGRNERPKRAHQKPRKFDDMVLYTIFE